MPTPNLLVVFNPMLPRNLAKEAQEAYRILRDAQLAPTEQNDWWSACFAEGVKTLTNQGLQRLREAQANPAGCEHPRAAFVLEPTEEGEPPVGYCAICRDLAESAAGGASAGQPEGAPSVEVESPHGNVQGD